MRRKISQLGAEEEKPCFCVFQCSHAFLLSEANGAAEAQGIVGRTPPQSAARTKSRQAKTPTQAGEFVYTHYILPLFIYLYLLYLA